MKKVISTSNAPAAIGPYSQAIQVGNMLFMSGQLGIDPSTGAFSEGGVTEQTIQSFKNMNAILTEAGYTIAYSGASPFSIPEVHSAPKSGKLAPF